MIVNGNRLHLKPGFTTWFEQDADSLGDNIDKYVNRDKIVVSDCDGVITDSHAIYGADGKKFKIYGAYDKEMMNYLHSFGWKFLFVSSDSEGMPVTRARLDHLNSKNILTYFECGHEERFNIIREYVDKNYIVCFIGDSLSDIASLNIATFAGTTANAPAEVKKYCDFISELDGASGGFADLIYNFHLKTFNMV